jgi:hypothetical protein
MSFLEGAGRLPLRNSPEAGCLVRKELIMSETTDPPSVERKSAGVGKRMRGFGRKFVNRRTLIAAFQVVYWTARIVRVVRQMFGDL